MSKNLTGPRALSAFRPETLRTAEGRGQQVQAFCTAVREAFERRGTVQLAWVWVQQNPAGAPAPAILAIELLSAPEQKTQEELLAFEARLAKAADLGKALAVAIVTEQASRLQVQFETAAGTEVLHAPIRSGRDPLNPSALRRVLEPFASVEH